MAEEKVSPITQIPDDPNLGRLLETSPDQFPATAPVKGYGFWSELSRTFSQQSEWAMADRFSERIGLSSNPNFQNNDPDWKPTDDQTALAGIQQKNAGYILDARSQSEQNSRRNYVLNMQEEQQRIDQGSTIGSFIGGMGAIATNPSTLASMIPYIAVAKYATYPSSFLMKGLAVTGGVGIQSFGHAGIEEATSIGGNLNDALVKGFMDFAVNGALFGTLHTVGKFVDWGRVFNAKRLMQMNYEGIKVNTVLDKDGKPTGFRAESIDGSVGAAKVQEAQSFLDGNLKANFLHGIPYVGTSLGTAAGNAAAKVFGTVNPFIRMVTSDFPTLRKFAGAVKDHGLETSETQAGMVNPDSFEHYVSKIQATNTAMSHQYMGFFREHNGIENSNQYFDWARDKYAEWQKNGYDSLEQFGNKVNNVLINDVEDKSASVNEAARMLRTQMDEYWDEYRNTHNLPADYLPPKTAQAYMFRMYNIPYLETQAGRESFLNTVSHELSNDDQFIQSRMQPIRSLEQLYADEKGRHDALIRQPNIADEQVKVSSDNLDAIKKRLDKEKDDLQNEIKTNPDLHRHADDMNGVSADEAKQIIALQKPIKEKEKLVEKQKAVVQQIKLDQVRSRSAARKAKTAMTAKKRIKFEDEHTAKLAQEEATLKKLQDDLDLEREALQEKMHNKQIPGNLYYQIKDSYRYELKDHTERLKLREVYESDYHRQVAAQSAYDSIMNESAEDTIAKVLGRLNGGDRANPTQQRSLMIRDQSLYDSNLLSPHPHVSVMNYKIMLGRRTAMKKALRNLVPSGEMEDVVRSLKMDIDAERTKAASSVMKMREKIKSLREKTSLTEPEKQKLADLQAKLPVKEKKLGKKDIKIKRKGDKAIEDMSLTHDKMMGKTNHSQKAREISRLLNSFAVATRLGNVPLTMTTDLMAIVFKHGFWPTVRDGLLPALQSLGTMANSKMGAAIRENAAHANMAYNHINTAYHIRDWRSDIQTYVPAQKQFVTGMENMAHLSQNIALTNYLENFLQRITAFVVQSKMIGNMIKYKEGTLGERELSDMLKYGLDPKVWADRFIKNWQEAGSDSNGLGGYVSRHWEWKDLEAANRMSDSTRRATKDTIIRGGMLDAPFAMDNPVFSTVFAFKRWTMASMTRYLLPLMQSPDANKLSGTILMLMAGATQNPLRRLAEGKDPIQDGDNWFINAMNDGGVFSSITEPLMTANMLTEGAFFNDMKNERYANRSTMGLLSGPSGGAVTDIIKIGNMIRSGEVNQTDVRRAARLIPAAHPFYLRWLSNQMVEGMNIPKTRSEARAIKRAEG